MLEIAILCLSLNIFHEARNQPIEGQRAVAEVTMNRSNGDSNKVCKTVLQPKQFSWTNKLSDKSYREKIAAMKAMQPKGKRNQDAWEMAKTIAIETLSGESKTIASFADHFYNPRFVTPRWTRGMTVIARIGDHVFLRS